MEEVLKSIDRINKIKKGIQKEIYEKFRCRVDENSIEIILFSPGDTKFRSLEELSNNKEFNKLLKKYLDFNSLFEPIINFKD